MNLRPATIPSFQTLGSLQIHPESASRFFSIPDLWQPLWASQNWRVGCSRSLLCPISSSQLTFQDRQCCTLCLCSQAFPDCTSHWLHPSSVTFSPLAFPPQPWRTRRVPLTFPRVCSLETGGVKAHRATLDQWEHKVMDERECSLFQPLRGPFWCTVYTARQSPPARSSDQLKKAPFS